MPTPWPSMTMLGNAANREYSDVIATFSYRYGIRLGQYSFATTVGLMQVFISFGLVAFGNWMARRLTNYSLWQGCTMLKRSVGEKVFDTANVIMMVFFTLAWVYPFIYVLAISLNDALDSNLGGIYFFPRKFSLESYRTILLSGDLPRRCSNGTPGLTPSTSPTRTPRKRSNSV